MGETLRLLKDGTIPFEAPGIALEVDILVLSKEYKDTAKAGCEELFK